MNSGELTRRVKEKALELGADLIGVANAERWAEAPRKLSPQAHLPGARSVVVMGIHHPDASVEWGGLPNSNYAGPFQIGMIPKLDTMSARMAEFLDASGAKAVPYSCTGFWRHRPYKEIDSTNTASFSNRHAAVAAGMGEFGWNNMFMSAKYGPRQRLISVITDAVLEPDPLYSGEPLCDRCMMCAKHCPGANYKDEYLLKPGHDTVKIEDKEWRYAKLNRWRCLWGEQFAMDMSQLKDFDIREEEDLYKAVDAGVPRLGGEFGNCLRYCMAKGVRFWQKQYSSAPRRRKAAPPAETADGGGLVEKILAIAAANGVDRLEISPLAEFSDSEAELATGYPLPEMRKHFQWVVSFGRRISPYPSGNALLQDNEDYLRAATKVRMSICAYEIAAYLDDLGFEAMQDWMSLSEAAFKKDDWADAGGSRGEYVFAPGEARPSPRAERYKPAALGAVGVQREQQSMTAGAENQKTAQQDHRVISCAVICAAPLSPLRKRLAVGETRTSAGKAFPAATADLATTAAAFNVDRIGVAEAGALPDGLAALTRILPGAKRLVCLMKKIPRHVAESANCQEAECATSYSLLQYQTLRELLWTAHDVCGWLEAAGHRALPLADLSLHSRRTAAPYWEFSWAKLGLPDQRANAPAAAAAGLGAVGRSGQLLAPEFGPHHKFIFVLTDAELPLTTGARPAPICQDCGACVSACPVAALSKEGVPAERDEARCEWARSMAMIQEEGCSGIGWDKPSLPVPDQPIDVEEAIKALNAKDPLQVKAYLYPCQIDTVVERCVQACPAR